MGVGNSSLAGTAVSEMAYNACGRNTVRFLRLALARSHFVCTTVVKYGGELTQHIGRARGK
jgi:hypothetical protein